MYLSQYIHLKKNKKHKISFFTEFHNEYFYKMEGT